MEIKFKKVHSIKDLAISAIILAAGIGLYFIHAGLGAFFVACGLLILLFYKSSYQREGDKMLLSKEAVEVSRSCKDAVMCFLEGKSSCPELDPGNAGGIIRLEVYYNSKRATAYAQLFDFSNYDYEPLTGIIEMHGPRVDDLLKALGK